MIFYEKKKSNILDLLTTETKLKINWDLVKNGTNINEVFRMNPVGLEEFLRDNSQSNLDLIYLLEKATRPNYIKKECK